MVTGEGKPASKPEMKQEEGGVVPVLLILHDMMMPPQLLKEGYTEELGTDLCPCPFSCGCVHWEAEHCAAPKYHVYSPKTWIGLDPRPK